MSFMLRGYNIFTKVAKLRNLAGFNQRLPVHIFANTPCTFQSDFAPYLSSVRCFAKGANKPSKKGSKFMITDDELSEFVDVLGYRNKLEEILSNMKSDYIDNLSVRSSSGAIESLKVKVEGNEFPLNELAQISRKNPNLIAINMTGFPDGLKPVLNAINESGLGLNPQQEGTMIYLPIPKVTRELREKLAKNAKTLFVKSKDDIRKIQNDFIRNTKELEGLSKDTAFGAQNRLIFIADEFSSEAEKMMKTKQKELLGET